MSIFHFCKYMLKNEKYCDHKKIYRLGVKKFFKIVTVKFKKLYIFKNKTI
jgi:hypothetical protein